MARYKIELLKRSFTKSPSLCLKQLYQMFRDKVFGPRFLVYTAAKSTLRSGNLSYPEGFTIQSFDNWLQVDPFFRKIIQKELKDEYWGRLEWCDLGWRLWIGSFDGQPAIVSWTRSGKQSTDFFFPLTDDCILIWQTVTFQKFRGRGIFSILLQHIIKTMCDQGIEIVYCSCRDFNYPSMNAIVKAGFTFIGYGKKKCFTGRGRFYSTKKLFALG